MVSKTQRWIDTLAAFVGGREATCPYCGSHNLNHGYVELNRREHIGWGALWCEDCRNAFVMSRVILKDAEIRKKLMPVLPSDLKFI